MQMQQQPHHGQGMDQVLAAGGNFAQIAQMYHYVFLNKSDSIQKDVILPITSNLVQ